MHQLPVLDRLVLDALPIWRKIPVLKVDSRSPNHIVPKDIIIIHNLDLQRSASRESAFELEVLEEIRVRIVLLVVISFIEDILSAAYN